MATGTTARSPFRAVSVRLARQAWGLAATSTAPDAGKLTLFVPHNSSGRARNGLDSEISNPPWLWLDAVTRSAGGTVTVSVRRNGRGPATRTKRWVCPPGGTCIRTTFPPGECLLRRPLPSSDTVRWLRARISPLARPSPGISRTVTVFEDGDSAHARWGAPDAAIAACWPRAATIKPIKTSSPGMARTLTRNGGRRPGAGLPSGRADGERETVRAGSAMPLVMSALLLRHAIDSPAPWTDMGIPSHCDSELHVSPRGPPAPRRNRRVRITADALRRPDMRPEDVRVDLDWRFRTRLRSL